MLDAGYTRLKIKIGAGSLEDDLRRIDAVLEAYHPRDVAVDAMNAYDREPAARAADALAPYGLWWLEDVCDPHDFDTQRAVTERYDHPVAAGEPIFSAQEAALLARYGGLRADRDILVFDPAHCYGFSGFLRIVRTMVDRGWTTRSFWPHGGHLFSLHVAAALDLGGTEVNPASFSPFGGIADGDVVENGVVRAPDDPGLGFERRRALLDLFRTMC